MKRFVLLTINPEELFFDSSGVLTNMGNLG